MTKRTLMVRASVALAVAASVAGSGVSSGAETVPPDLRRGATTTRVSVSSSGEQANGTSDAAVSISRDGRYVAFASNAPNLVPGDTNGTFDVFVRDRVLGLTRRVSLGSTGRQGNEASFDPSVSADGRYVAFVSHAWNLVPGDTNSRPDIFVRDRRKGLTWRVSVGPGGRQVANSSSEPEISPDGRYVAFTSAAPHIVRGDTNGVADVFMWDRKTRMTRRASVGPGGRQGDGASFSPSICARGRCVAFGSAATNLVAGDTNGAEDVFVHDQVAATTQRLSISTRDRQAHGASYSPSISPDGRYVAFVSSAANLVAAEDGNRTGDIFVRDRRRGVTRRVSVRSDGGESNDASLAPSISGNGRYVAFMSFASNLVPRDTNLVMDVFVRDRRRQVTRRASLTAQGEQAELDGPSSAPSISDVGRSIAFQSIARNLVAGDTNNGDDVFVRSRTGGPGVRP